MAASTPSRRSKWWYSAASACRPASHINTSLSRPPVHRLTQARAGNAGESVHPHAPAASDGARRPGRGRPWPAGPAPVDQVSVNTLYRHPPNKSTKGQSRELSQTCRYMPSLEFATTFSHAPTGRVE
jgi:hypothetical protein